MNREERTKVCRGCHIERPYSDFHAKKSNPDGRANKCKNCCADYQQAYYLKHHKAVRSRTEDYRQEHHKQYAEYARGHRARYPQETKARTAVRDAVKSGKLSRRPCLICGAADVQAHHEDYGRPLDVKWLCAAHHTAIHNARRSIK